MREVVACVAWMITGAVIIAAMFTDTNMWISVPVVFGAVCATAIALPVGRPAKPPAAKEPS